MCRHFNHSICFFFFFFLFSKEKSSKIQIENEANTEMNFTDLMKCDERELCEYVCSSELYWSVLCHKRKILKI